MTSMRCRHGNWPYECEKCVRGRGRRERESALNQLLVAVAEVVTELAETHGLDPSRILVPLSELAA